MDTYFMSLDDGRLWWSSTPKKIEVSNNAYVISEVPCVGDNRLTPWAWITSKILYYNTSLIYTFDGIKKLLGILMNST